MRTSPVLQGPGNLVKGCYIAFQRIGGREGPEEINRSLHSIGTNVKISQKIIKNRFQLFKVRRHGFSTPSTLMAISLSMAHKKFKL